MSTQQHKFNRFIFLLLLSGGGASPTVLEQSLLPPLAAARDLCRDLYLTARYWQAVITTFTPLLRSERIDNQLSSGMTQSVGNPGPPGAQTLVTPLTSAEGTAVGA